MFTTAAKAHHERRKARPLDMRKFNLLEKRRGLESHRRRAIKELGEVEGFSELWARKRQPVRGDGNENGPKKRHQHGEEQNSLPEHSSEKHHWNQNDNADDQACSQLGLVSCMHFYVGNATTT